VRRSRKADLGGIGITGDDMDTSVTAERGGWVIAEPRDAWYDFLPLIEFDGVGTIKLETRLSRSGEKT
jgi:hypothetical protein